MKTNNTKTDDMKPAATVTGSKTVGTKNASPKKDVSCGEDFHNFFVEQIKDIYWAEKHLKKGLDKMRRSATVRNSRRRSRSTTARATSR